MHRSLPVPLICLLGLLLGLPARLGAQQVTAATSPMRFSRIVSSVRLHAMLQPSSAPPANRSSIVTPTQDPISFPIRPPVRFTGRSIRVLMAGPVDLKAGLSWWSTGFRTDAGFTFRF